jgi:hypothetical protein
MNNKQVNQTILSCNHPRLGEGQKSPTGNEIIMGGQNANSFKLQKKTLL